MVKKASVFTISIILFCTIVSAAEFPYNLVYNKSIQRNMEYSYIEKLANGNFLLAGREPSSSYNAIPLFTTINPNGGIVSNKLVNTSPPSGGSYHFGSTNIFKYNDKYIICGQVSGYSYGKVMLVDSNFNPLWTYAETSGDFTYKFAYGYNNIIYTICRESPEEYDNGQDYYYLQPFDMNGNKLTRKTIRPSYSSSWSISRVIWAEDGTFIVTGALKKSGKISLITMKYSLQGTRIWEQEIPLNYTTDGSTGGAYNSTMIRLKNGDIAIAVSRNIGYTAPYWQRVYIYSESGQLLKTLVPTTQYKLQEMIELEDNTLLLAGHKDSTYELYVENISLTGDINYSNTSSMVHGIYGMLVDGADLYILSYSGISYSDIAYNLLTKFSLKPPTISLSANNTKIGDNTPVTLNLSFNIYGNAIKSVKILDASNNQYYNSDLTNSLSFNVNEGSTTIKAQIIGSNGTTLATSNSITIEKRNLLNKVLEIAYLQNGLQKAIILDDTDRYYENNTANQQLISQIKKKLSGFFIISNDVSPVLTPLLEN